MRLFGRKAARGAVRPVLARGWQAAAVALGEWPRSYEAQVRDAYLGNAVAQRAVRLVAEGVASLVVTGEDAAVRLVSAESGGQGLMETIAAHLLLHGNGYVEVAVDAGGRPGELFALRPERVSVEADASGWPAAYLYRVGDRVARFVPADRAAVGNVTSDARDRVIHLKRFHPLDDHYGLGCLGAAAGAVAIHNAATRWNKALLDNAARPSGALVYAPGENGATLSADQYDKLRAEMDASFAGAANAGRPMLLEGGLSWQAMSLTPADMDFVGLKAAAAREIALAFGVPPLLLGLPGDATYANYSEANRALWRQTIVPLATKILDGIAGGLSAWWPGMTLGIDLDRVPALAEDRERLWAQVTAADFLTSEEKRKLVGIA